MNEEPVIERERCYYCKELANKIMVCNDWDNIPLCKYKKCLTKFNKENVSQFYVMDLEDTFQKRVRISVPRNIK